ncbi:kelch domain-containing protein family protein [Loa loa]|uniref:Kelch domain-containing protein family protein n=1 Tax=Loa loa TaxID=7209 RepID=A0A1I7V5B9_LOALO|nr:kelch domain-containing protein family protein [Loa loa]EFO22877.1 kelch domain-containing protein family protein [Loa loa]
MGAALLAAMFLHASTVIYSSVHIERIGSASVSKNCDNKPCYQGKCENEKCRCFAGWGGVHCDRCHGRNLLMDESELLTDGPRNYSSSSRCMWIIRDEKKRGALLLRIDSLVTECSWDHLYIYDGTGTRSHQLAAFSGVISGREVSIKSGKALVYFFSDLAFNMSGFNITFAYGKCPSNCTSNGKCTEGICECYEGYTGVQCDTLICTDKDRNKTSKACGMAGICDSDNRCSCNMHFHGDRCQALTTQSVFETVSTSGDFGARASHTAILVNDTKIWVIGGAHFTGVNNSFVAVYDIANSSWHKIPTKNTPKSRYDHTVVKYKSTIYMFGGVIDERVVTNELWSLDLGTLEWTLENTNNNASDAIPGAVAGHAAHLIGDEMLVFYGHSPYFGYMYSIQKYKISTKRWSIVPDHGPHVQGRFGHSLVAYVHEKKEVILIYGGYLLPYEGFLSRVSSTLIEYVCDSRECSHRTLSSGHTPVFRHSASLINDLMIIIGGNVHNESSSRIQECYSGDIQAYDIGCDTWFSLSNNNLSFLQRYGHSSMVTKHNIFVIGGFNGVMLSDVVKFTPAECGGLKRPDDCRNMREGVRCIFHAGKCKPVQRDMSYTHSFLSYVKNDDPKEEQKCPISWRKSVSWCSEEKDCASCTAVEGCSWCHWSRECVSDNLCKDRTNPIAKSDACPKDEEPRPCFFAAECYACKKLKHCSWFLMKDSKWKCVNSYDLLLEGEAPQQQHSYFQSEHTSPLALNALNPSSKNESCPAPCWFHEDCQVCIREQCMWCPTTARCVSMDAYMINFPYGQCQSWVTATNIISNQHACQLDPMDCSKQKTCAECQRVGPNCGWCDDGSGTGLGRCLPGSLEAPDNELFCPKDGKSKWYFTNCSACQCNGHSNCTLKSRSLEWNIEERSCTQCDHNTTGEHCQFCADGFYGDPRNGGRCEECFCNGQATMCNRETGDCYCTTKGVTGKNCSKCEPKYYGDPENNQLCYYELTVDFIFTFKLDQDDPKDKYVNQINFFSTPHKRDTDVQFTVVCESPKSEKALVSMSINSSLFEGHPGSNKLLMTRTVCDENGIRRAYSANAEPGFVFGTDANTTFLVKVYNFSTPIKIQISFSQSPPINWVLFFVIFAACFVVLLVVAGLLWMIKLRIEVFRRNQRRYDEIEQMASRPFASVRLELTSPRANLMATPISVEPCSNYRSGVFTLAVRLPTGGRQFTPHGTSGLAVASALCLLTQAQLGILQAAETSDANHNRKTTLMRYIPFIRS